MNVESKVPYGLVFETKQEREGASVDPNYWQANDAANAAIQVLTLLALRCKQTMRLSRYSRYLLYLNKRTKY